MWYNTPMNVEKLKGKTTGLSGATGLKKWDKTKFTSTKFPARSKDMEVGIAVSGAFSTIFSNLDISVFDDEKSLDKAYQAGLTLAKLRLKAIDEVKSV